MNKLILFLILLGFMVSCQSPSSTKPDTTAPTLSSSTPSNGATGITLDSQILLNFSESIDADSLSISSSPELNLGTAILTSEDKTASYSPTNLVAGSLYTLSINVKDKAGNASEAISLSFSTESAASDTTPPAVPVIGQITAGDSQIIIDWQANTETDLKDYLLLWGLAEDALSNTQTVTKEANSYTLTGLSNDTAYFLALKATDVSGNSSLQSTVMSAMPKALAIPDTTAPTLLESNPANNTTDTPVNTALSFTFSEAMDTSSFSLNAFSSSQPAVSFANPNWTLGNTKVSLSPTASLEAGQSYSFTLNANDSAGNALAASTLSFTTASAADTTPPAKPSNLSATAGNAQISLTWQANSEADLASYTLYWGTSTSLDNQQTLAKTQTSKALTGLSNGTKYYFALDAVDASGNHSAKTSTINTTPVAPPPPPPAAPVITETNPVNGAVDVAIGQFAIVLKFSKAMDKTSVENAISFSPNYRGFVGSFWSADGKTLEYAVALEQFTNYTVTIAKTAKAQDGAFLANPYSFSFKSGNLPPRLVSSIPANGETNVSKDLGGMVLTFSEPLQSNIEVVRPFQCDYDLVSGSEIHSDGCQFYDGNIYTVSYKVEDESGQVVQGSISFSTEPDISSPEVVGGTPINGQTLVSTNAPIYINFNDEMDEASTLAAVSSSLDLGCTWKLSASKTSLSCVPTNLQAATTYTISVTDTAKDTSGKQLSGVIVCPVTPPCNYTYKLKFSTGPIIDATDPTIDTATSEPKNNATGVSLTAPITIAFSEKMNQPSAESAFSVISNGSRINGSFGWFGSGMVFFPDPNYPVCSFVDVSIGQGALDLSGNPLQTAYAIRFKTECF